LPRRRADSNDFVSDFYKEELKKRQLRDEYFGVGQDPRIDPEVDSRANELKKKRLKRDILIIDQQIAEFEKPKPPEKPEPTASQKIVDEAEKEVWQLLEKDLVRKAIFALDNPSRGPNSGEVSPEVAKMTREMALETFRELDGPERDALFPRALRSVSNLPRIKCIVKEPMYRDGKPVTYDSGEPKIKSTLVLESKKPEAAKRAREAIKKEMEMDVEVLTYTEGLERGLVQTPVPKNGTEKPSEPSQTFETSVQ
jgi:hypothetical protein